MRSPRAKAWLAKLPSPRLLRAERWGFGFVARTKSRLGLGPRARRWDEPEDLVQEALGEILGNPESLPGPQGILVEAQISCSHRGDPALRAHGLTLWHQLGVRHLSPIHLFVQHDGRLVLGAGGLTPLASSKDTVPSPHEPKRFVLEVRRDRILGRILTLNGTLLADLELLEPVPRPFPRYVLLTGNNLNGTRLQVDRKRVQPLE